MSSTSPRTFPKAFLLNLILFGFVGQIAWNVENIYFNTFLYNVVYSGVSNVTIQSSINVIDAVSKMVAYSAVTAVLTTFLMGTLSDKLGSRRRFVCFGYIIWGIVTGMFGLISRDHIATLFHLTDEGSVLTFTVWAVILMDCFMTFVGSTANDAGFNAWITDSTDTHNRASAESVLSILPFAATGLVLGLGGLLLAGADKQKSYSIFFLVLGALVILCGLIGLFSLKDPPGTKKTEGRYLSNLVYGFRPSVVKDNQKIYLTLIAICLYSIAAQVFFPYLIIYLEHSDDRFFDPETFHLTPALIGATVVAIVVVVAGILLAGKLVDRHGKDRFVVPVLAVLVLGLVLLSRAHTLTALFLSAIPTLFGYALMGIMLNAAIRDFTPENKAGLFQGIRMVFVVMLPMVIGPVIGKNAILSSGASFIDEYGAAQTVPTSSMFLYAGIVASVALIPIVIILKKGGFRISR